MQYRTPLPEDTPHFKLPEVFLKIPRNPVALFCWSLRRHRPLGRNIYSMVKTLKLLFRSISVIDNDTVYWQWHSFWRCHSASKHVGGGEKGGGYFIEAKELSFNEVHVYIENELSLIFFLMLHSIADTLYLLILLEIQPFLASKLKFYLF